MKKIYTAPVCELLGTMTTDILTDSNSVHLNMAGTLQDDLKYGGVDENNSHEADANEMVWDHFDKGLK
ncbi:MAG: hypothetical protein J6Y23_10560 [Prevotella sp.]|nr:hypothetical protein [Prevotella sp.]